MSKTISIDSKEKQKDVKEQTVQSSQNEITTDDIAIKAYLIWESNNCCHGSDVEHWLMAEQVLKERK